jgi:3-hydroxyacyl-CoA dehydrogenase/enoyl-CoA hydratase/3-hydroxybutyryl-CoA epimerase
MTHKGSSLNLIAQVLGDDHVTMSKSTQTVDLVVDSSSIAWVVLNNRTKSVNVIDAEFVEDLNTILDVIEELTNPKPNVKLVIFASTKKNSFVVGADINNIYGVLDNKLAEAGSRRLQALFDRVNALRVPTVAAINGDALGGGLELALACKYRFVIDTKKAILGLPEVKLGVIPGAGGTVRLPKIIGLQQSLGIILAGSSVSPKTAKELGLVDLVLPAQDRFQGENRFLWNIRRAAVERLDRGITKTNYKPKTIKDMILDTTWVGRKVVANMALKNLDKQTKGKYPAPYAALESVIYSTKEPNQRALHLEAQLFGRMAVTAESKNLIAIFNLMEGSKKIPPRLNAKPLPLNYVTVIGAGVMGSGIAQLALSKGYNVYMKDIKDEFVERGMSVIKGILEGQVKRGRLTTEEMKTRLSRLKAGTSYDLVSTADIVIEAAVEKMDLKKQVLKDCENANSNIIFATNTSTLSINELATASKNPSRVIGMHFFNPVHKMPLVEIIVGKDTSSLVTATIYGMALKLGKTPIIVKDGPGFLVNRILGVFMLEAAGRMFAQEGGDLEQIDNVLMEWGFPMGAFRLMDEVGIDVGAHSGKTLTVLGDRFNLPGENTTEAMVSKGYLGKKTGKGFYIYESGKKPVVNHEGIKEVFPIYDSQNRKKFAPNDIVDRCVLLMVNEAAMILEEGIAACPEDVDIGMVFGTGFAPFRGGLLNYVDQRGVKVVVKRLNELQQRYGDRFKPAPLLMRMALKDEKFYPNRPNIVFSERLHPPRPKL